jgi:hypothetical protein
MLGNCGLSAALSYGRIVHLVIRVGFWIDLKPTTMTMTMTRTSQHLRQSDPFHTAINSRTGQIWPSVLVMRMLIETQKVVMILLVAVVVTPTSSATTTNTRQEVKDTTKSCPLWIAPSNMATSEVPKYGLFAGQTYAQNSTLQFSELAIPFVDFFGVDRSANYDNTVHSYIEDDDDKKKNNDMTIISFLEDLLWTPEFTGTAWEGNYSTPCLIPGLGVLANYHSGFSNSEFLQASMLLRHHQKKKKAWAEHEYEPGVPHIMRGTMTPYFNATLHATREIPTGMEIIADFGDVWDGNFTENIYQDQIHRYDYEIADKLVNGLINLLDKFPTLSLDLKEDVVEFMLTKALQTATGANAKTIRSLIPDNPRKLKKVQQAGGTFMYRYQDMIKTPRWLQQNGFCLDTIKEGISDIPNAGRGAFANRPIRKGEVITITPMIHIADKSLLTMYPIVEVEDPKTGEIKQVYDKASGPIGVQLAMNYCFGHPESSMLLFPVAPQVTLINNGHGRAGHVANAYIMWTKDNDPMVNPKDLLDWSIDQMAQLKEVSLVMKILALVDINEGEEILLDYGKAWEAAYEKYKADWKAAYEGGGGKEEGRHRVVHPLKAEDVRVMYHEKPFETIESYRETRPYPETVRTTCFLESRDRPAGMVMIDQKYGHDITEFASPVSYELYHGSNLHLVDIVDRHEAMGYFYNYTVRALLGSGNIEEVVNVPHSACTFVDDSYTSDIHTRPQFRHPMGILDSHFPNNWRNLR